MDGCTDGQLREDARSSDWLYTTTFSRVHVSRGMGDRRVRLSRASAMSTGLSVYVEY